MDTPEPAMPILTLRDIFAFNQADLAQYLSEVQMEDGEDDLNGRGFGTLAGDHRGELPEGMSTPAPIPDHAPQSHPVSARGLAALLQFIADNNILPEVLAHPSFPGPSSPSPTPESDGDAVRKRFEIEAYHDLVRDGARPLYPIRLLDDVARDPERYRDLLRPLQDDPAASPPDWEVFQRQLERWRDFRRWQRDNRRIYDEDREFAEFLEQERRRLAKGKAQPGYAARTAAEYEAMLRDDFRQKEQERNGHDDDDDDDDNDREHRFAAFVADKKKRDFERGLAWPGMTADEHAVCLRNRFDRNEFQRYWRQFYWLRADHGRGGFAGYVREARARLAAHGFRGGAFRFDPDPARQDQRTTYIEYLHYEYAWYDKHVRSVRYLQPTYDESLQELLDAGILREGETVASLRDAVQRCARETREAEQAVAAAGAAAREALGDDLGGDEEEDDDDNDEENRAVSRHCDACDAFHAARVRQIADAYAQVARAREVVDQLRMRSDIMVQFIRESWDYDRARDDVHRQTFLLRWILDQIPLMEAEMRDTGSSSSPALDASDLDGYYEIDPDWQPSAADSRSNNHHYNDDDNDDGNNNYNYDNNNYNYDNNNSSNNNNILPRLPPLNLPATEPPRTLPSFPPATDSFPPLAEILRTGLVTQSTHSNSYISVPPDQSVDAARTYRSAAPSVESLASTPSRKRAAGSPANDTAGDPAPSGETALQQQPKRPKVDQQQQEQRQQQQSTGSSHSLAQQQEQQHHHQPQQQQPTNNDATTYDRLQPADHSPGPVASQAPRFGALPSPSGSPSPLHL